MASGIITFILQIHIKFCFSSPQRWLTLVIFTVWPTEFEILHVFSWNWQQWWYERREFLNYFLTTTFKTKYRYWKRFEFWRLLLHHWQLQLLFKIQMLVGDNYSATLWKSRALKAVAGVPSQTRQALALNLKSLLILYCTTTRHAW